MDSILLSVKKNIGIPYEDPFFDPSLIMHINSVFSILRQIGCGPSEGYFITDAGNDWNDFLQNDPKKLQLVKTYMSMRVKQMFDPPVNGTVAQAAERQISELEWRISTICDPGRQP